MSDKKYKTRGTKEPDKTVDEVMGSLSLGGSKSKRTKLKIGSMSPLSIWVDGAAKGNHIAGAGRVAGVGVVSGHPSVPHMFGPVEFNGTELATNNAAELQAAILGLEQALYRDIMSVHLHTDSQLLWNIMNKWMEQWKEKNWRKCDGAPLKISMDLLKRLDQLNSEMDITWTWVPRNSSPEMTLADTLANRGCASAIDCCNLYEEQELNRMLRWTVYDRRLDYPDELPPTVLRTKYEVQIRPKENTNILCYLEISDEMKQKLIKNKSEIMNLTSDQAYGYITVIRTADPMEEDGTVLAKCHISGSEVGLDVNGEIVRIEEVGLDVNGETERIEPTLVLPKGSVIGLAFSGPYGIWGPDAPYGYT